MTQDPKQSDNGEPCRTQVELRTTGQPPTDLHFFQLEAPGLERYRYVEMKATGGDLLVSLLTEVPERSTDQAPGCRKLLRAGNLEEIINGSVGLTVVVPAEQSFRFHFRPLFANTPLWAAPGDFVEPFALGAPQLRPTDPPLQAHAVIIRSLDGATETLSARSTDNGPLLSVQGLKIGSDQIQISVAGRGWVQSSGASKTVNLLERVQQYPILAAILGGLNAALLAWIGRLIFGKRWAVPTE